MGLEWLRTDLRDNDHTHPSKQGCEKVSARLLDCLKKDPASRT